MHSRKKRYTDLRQLCIFINKMAQAVLPALQQLWQEVLTVTKSCWNFHDRQIPNFSRLSILFPKQFKDFFSFLKFKDFSSPALNSRPAGARTLFKNTRTTYDIPEWPHHYYRLLMVFGSEDHYSPSTNCGWKVDLVENHLHSLHINSSTMQTEARHEQIKQHWMKRTNGQFWLKLSKRS